MAGWTPGLFDDAPSTEGQGPARRIELAPGACLLPAFASAQASDLVRKIEAVAEVSPFRHLVTPGGHRMSVAMTGCGDASWITTERGYTYAETDPLTQRPWPPLPTGMLELAQAASSLAGFEHFHPSACLINRYEPGARLSLHQDRDEQDLSQPIVSVSLGLPAVFLLGGHRREDRTLRRRLEHGDVVVWGGEARLRFHGVLPIEGGAHPVTGPYRYNLTFRAAGRR